MKAVIMAGGLGMRLRPITSVIPKPLLPIGDRTVLEIIIEKLKKSGFDEIMITTNYKSHLFETFLGDGSRLGVRINYSKEKERLGTAGPLRLIRKDLNEPFLVINGDIITMLDFSKLAEFHKKNSADFTLVSKELDIPLQYGVVECDGNRITDIKEKPPLKAEIIAGIYFMNPGIIDMIPKGPYLMTDLVKKAIREGKNVFRYSLTDYWLDIGRMEDYEKAKKESGRW